MDELIRTLRNERRCPVCGAADLATPPGMEPHHKVYSCGAAFAAMVEERKVSALLPCPAGSNVQAALLTAKATGRGTFA